MIDIKLIRENIEVVKENLRKRNTNISLDKIQGLEKDRLVLMKEVEALRNSLIEIRLLFNFPFLTNTYYQVKAAVGSGGPNG